MTGHYVKIRLHERIPTHYKKAGVKTLIAYLIAESPTFVTVRAGFTDTGDGSAVDHIHMIDRGVIESMTRCRADTVIRRRMDWNRSE